MVELRAQRREFVKAVTAAAGGFLSALGLGLPMRVLASEISIDGLLWWSNPLAVTRHTRIRRTARRTHSPTLPGEGNEDGEANKGTRKTL